jgi:hypothetical protein
MIKKPFIYMLPAIRAVFLFAVTSVGYLFSRSPFRVAGAFRSGLILVLFLTIFNFQGFTQNCPPGQRICKGSTECQPARNCRQGVPPPPGLPIDSKLPYLLIAGIGLGIYYLRSKKVS